jgi:large subunit ribosomal protein L7A
MVFKMHDLADPDKRIVGLKQVLKGVKEGVFAKIYVASDADEIIRLKILSACAENKIIYEEVFSMLELGNACAIDVGAATAGVLK